MNARPDSILSHRITTADRRIKPVIAWLAVFGDKFGVAHGLLQS